LHSALASFSGQRRILPANALVAGVEYRQGCRPECGAGRLIADTVSFSQAAAQLGRTQSAVSLQIKRLEAVLGRVLLRRVQGRVDGATDEGVR
jgi:hypothetical protein